MCECANMLNEKLLEYNTCLDIPTIIDPNTLGLSAERTLVATAKVDTHKRGNPKRVFASYCPFCGTSYDRAAELPDAPAEAVAGQVGEQDNEPVTEIDRSIDHG